MNYTDLLISQYATRPRARATIQALEDDMKRSRDGTLSVAGMLNIETATGVSLDVIGKIVGQSRVLTGAVARELHSSTKAPLMDFSAAEREDHHGTGTATR
ncbi:DUF2612 domain-containing protein [Enterobacteriaceae bacterium BIT-l23]|uniref:DUF2612 domain-containing protein n=1 Tax=Jejubacter sp. L23 TaxID=3092086 RepID=UPI0015858F75|nr:DUF2612 domain-containing protein [Enterobacteriaceae bacterium BIT-l23]